MLPLLRARMASTLPLLLRPISPNTATSPLRRFALAPRPASVSAPKTSIAGAGWPGLRWKAGGFAPLHATSAAAAAAIRPGGGVGGGKDWWLFAWYLMALDKHPLVTKAITSAVLTLAGDLICQIAVDRAPNIDFKRTFVFTFLGLVLVGPTLHVWYLYLSKLVTLKGASGAIARLLLDQFIFSPIFIGFFMSLLVTLEGMPSLVVPKLKQEWFSSVVANWQLWIPFQFLNFYFVPQKLQVLAANFIALAWNVILSFKAHKEVLVK